MLVWADGFDTYANSTDAGLFYQRDQFPSFNRSGAARTGVGCLSGSQQLGKSVPPQAAYVAGIAITAFTNQSNVLQFQDTNASVIVQCGNNATGIVEVGYFNNGVFTTTLGTSTAGSTGGYHYWELKVTNAGTGIANGTVTLHVDGIQVIAVTGVQLTTSVGANNPIAFVELATSNVFCDDFYICDLTGGQNNDFLGPISVYTLYPTADGATQQWGTNTPNASPNNYKNVNEATPDYDTSYDATGTVGQINDYAFSLAGVVPITQTVQGVMGFLVARDDLAGAADLATYIEQGAGNATGANVGLATSYNGIATPYDSNPCTSAAWVNADIASLSFGAKRTV